MKAIRLIFISGMLFFIAGLVSSYFALQRQVAIEKTTIQTVAFYGDSLAAGLGASGPTKIFSEQFLKLLDDSFPRVSGKNHAVSGARVQDVLTKQLGATATDLAILVVGTNDVIHQTDNETFKQDYQTLVSRLVLTHKQVIVFLVPKFSLTPVIPDEVKLLTENRINMFNKVIQSSAARNKVYVFDFYSLSEQELLNNDNLLASDKFHPNDAGYELLAKHLYQFILQDVISI